MTIYNVLFYPKGEYKRLFAYVTWKGCRFYISLGYKIVVDKWSKESQRAKKNTYHFDIPAQEINQKISYYENVINNTFQNLHDDPSVEEFKNAFNVAIGKAVENSAYNLQSLFSEYITQVSEIHSWSKGTKKKWKTISNHFSWFGKIVTIDDLTLDNFQKYVQYLIDTGYNNATTKREISFVFTFIRWCKKHDYYHGDIIEKFDQRLKTADNEIVYLSWEELQKLYSFDFGSDRLSQIRDVFCFQCFTSLRYSDVYNLTREQIYDDKIHIVTQKTSEHLEIDLNKYSKSIIDKYWNAPIEKALPVISNQKMNDALKEIGRIVELNDIITKVSYNGGKRIEKKVPKWQLLSTHCGRRTFVVNALYLGIPERVVRSWTGHADERAMKPYVKIVEELKADEMSKFDKK